MPRIEWNAQSLSGLLAALPLVGAVIGLVCWLFILLAGLLELPRILSAGGVTLIPLALSGGIHMDGFADTVDALKSYGDQEKKRAILKDPHVGAFAVIGTVCWLLLYFALCASLPLNDKMLALLGLTHVTARACGALAGAVLPSSSKQGMLYSFREAVSRSDVRILIGWLVISLAVAAVLMPLAAVLSAAAAAGVFLYVKRTARKQFGGMSGDLAGFCISVTEIALLAAQVLAERMVTLWF